MCTKKHLPSVHVCVRKRELYVDLEFKPLNLDFGPILKQTTKVLISSLKISKSKKIIVKKCS